MKKITLVSIGVSGLGFSQFARFLPMTAVGLHYIAATLKQNGYLVEIINQTNGKLNDADVIRKINYSRSDYVFFNQFFSMRKKIRHIISKLTINPIIVVGGHDITFHSQELKRDELNKCYEGIDYIWQGEAEKCLIPEIVLMKKQPIPIVINRLYERTNNLDKLPILKHDDYSGDVGFLVTSRGCYKKGCDICTTPHFYPNGWKARSVKHVTKEIKALKTAGKLFVFICDDNFLGFTDKHLNRGHQIILACKKAKIKIMIMTTKEQLLRAKEKQYLSMWKGVVYRCFLGIESGGIHVQNRIGKITNPVTHESVSIEAIRTLYANGISLFAGWINFKPDSTFDELEQDAKFLFKNGAECAIFTNICQSLRIYEGTAVYKKHKHRNVIVKNGEFDYDFNIQEVGKLYRFLMFDVRGTVTNQLDNLLFEIIDLVYINQLQNTALGQKYWQLRDIINSHNYNFFVNCLTAYKLGAKKIDKTTFIDLSKSYIMQLELLKQKIHRIAQYK